MPASAPTFWPVAPGPAEGPVGRREPGPFTMPLRHVPCADDMAAARAFFGEACEPVLEAWARGYAEAGLDPGEISSLLPGPPPDPAGGLRTLLDLAAYSRPTAASAAARLERLAGAKPIRDAAFHILEDAVFFVELSRAGADFALVGNPYALSPVVVSASGGTPPTLLRQEGPDAEAERHARAVRTIRASLQDPLPYWLSPAFQRLSGRDMALAEGTVHLGAVLADMARQGHRKAFLKHTLPKRGTWVADIAAPEPSIDGMALAAHAAMGPVFSDLDAASDAAGRQVLVQAFTPFTHEHRFLVVGHRIVASTPSDRAMGVLDAVPGRRIHPAAARLLVPASDAGAYDRGLAHPVADRGLVAAMARKARTCVRAFRREGLLPPDYCLDVGLSPRGILPIEVNGIDHCGVYAADWSRVARALAGRTGSEAGPPSVRSQGPLAEKRETRIREALDFILDILCDGPPSELRAVAAEVSRLAEAATGAEARALGVLARDAQVRETGDRPLDEGLVAEARAALGR